MEKYEHLSFHEKSVDNHNILMTYLDETFLVNRYKINYFYIK